MTIWERESTSWAPELTELIENFLSRILTGIVMIPTIKRKMGAGGT
jgi:hypothetical protein